VPKHDDFFPTSLYRIDDDKSSYHDFFTVQILLYFKQYLSQTYTQIIISSKQQFFNLFVFAYVYMDQLFYVLAAYVSS